MFYEEPKIWQYLIFSCRPECPLEIDIVQNALKAGVEVIGEVELAWRMGKGNYVAITGTNGKTTTTVLTGEIFKAAGRKTEVVGNRCRCNKSYFRHS